MVWSSRMAVSRNRIEALRLLERQRRRQESTYRAAKATGARFLEPRWSPWNSSLQCSCALLRTRRWYIFPRLLLTNKLL